jgi:type IV pilus assembly protein PilM
MSLLDQLAALVEEPPPSYAFEISAAGLAWATRPSSRKAAPQLSFAPWAAPVLNVTPVADNVLLPDLFREQVAAVALPNGRRRRDVALILPDYCARVTVLDFETFPTEVAEQTALVRFRLKKTVPFDVDSAALAYHIERGAARRIDVVVAAAAREIIARYEAPFRACGYNPGFVTTATLAALNLLPDNGLQVLTKLAGRVLTVAVCDGRHPKLVRTLELPDLTSDDIKAVVFPTLAYAEDTLGRHPERVYSCGLGDVARELEIEWNIPVEPLRSAWGQVNEANAGLLGWLQAQEGR